MEQLGPVDIAALSFFLISWVIYTLVADHSRWSKHGVSAYMNAYRRRWMEQMLRRELRMVDTQILGNLLTGIGFFASTTILLIGGLIAVLGASDRVMEALASLPYADHVSSQAIRWKLLLLVVIFVYAFFKFAWAFRLSNYCSVLIGAAPPATDLTPDADEMVAKAARLSDLVGRHVNRGMRAYFFGIAALAWFINPLALIASTILVLVILHRREFKSRAVRALSGQSLTD